jgi:hypothetical protein
MERLSPLPWDEPDWFERVEAWVDAELERLGLQPRGALELVRTRPWAAVARVSTMSGNIWFKEAAPPLAFEPGLTVSVARRCPNFTPVVLAAEGTSMITDDAGPQLRSFRKSGEPAPSWDEILPRYAELQIELADDVNELLKLGTPDRRPPSCLRPIWSWPSASPVPRSPSWSGYALSPPSSSCWSRRSRGRSP